RTATVTALSRVRLLVLNAHDLHALMSRSPVIAAHIRKVARERLSRELVSTTGDLVTEEILEDNTNEEPGPERAFPYKPGRCSQTCVPESGILPPTTSRFQMNKTTTAPMVAAMNPAP